MLVERPRPPISEADVLAKQGESGINRENSTLHHVERIISAAERLTGTQEGHESPKKLVLFMGVMIGGTLAAGQIPDHELSMRASELFGATGGAFIGENVGIFSRRARFKTKKYIKELSQSTQIDADQLVAFFAQYPDILTEEEVRQRLLGRLPALDQKTADDPRYQVVDKLSQIHKDSYTALRGGKNAKTYRESQKAFVNEKIMDAQLLAQTARALDINIRQEGVRKISDVLSGVLVVGAAAWATNVIFNSNEGGLVGVIDDALLVAGMLGTVAYRKLSETRLMREYQEGKAKRFRVSRPHMPHNRAKNLRVGDSRVATRRDGNQGNRR